jgi:hypothetical protein
MRCSVLLGALGIAAAMAFFAWSEADRCSREWVFVSNAKPPEAAPLCPWREPESDLKRFFPAATGYALETRILSGLRLELAERLGRTPSVEENALRSYRVYRETELVGTVVTRRVKGEYGSIELVLALNTNQTVRGLRLQRLREPSPIAKALEDPTWGASFVGKSIGADCRFDGNIADVPSGARASAQAITEGVRSCLVLLATAEQAQFPVLVQAHHK